MKSSRPSSLFDPLAEGQMVIVIARWVLVLAGLILILLDTQNPTQTVSFNVVRFEILVILLLAMSNFYFVAQMLTKRKALKAAVYGASAADLGVITLIIIAQGGFQSNVYTFYFPAILALSVAFATPTLYMFMGGVAGVYGVVGLTTLFFWSDTFAADLQALVIRLLMIAAVGVCGNYFARVEHQRMQARLQQNARLRGHGDPQAGAQSPAQQPS